MSDRDGVNYITEDEQDEHYADALDSVYGDVEIAGLVYATSYAQKELDPTAYRCGKNDYFASGEYVERTFDGEDVLVHEDDADEWDELDNPTD